MVRTALSRCRARRVDAARPRLTMCSKEAQHAAMQSVMYGIPCLPIRVNKAVVTGPVAIDWRPIGSRTSGDETALVRRGYLRCSGGALSHPSRGVPPDGSDDSEP